MKKIILISALVLSISLPSFAQTEHSSVEAPVQIDSTKDIPEITLNDSTGVQVATVATVPGGDNFFSGLAAKYGAYLGLFAALITFFNRLAKVTPTTWDNEALEKVMKVLYTIFAILGLKFPEIEKPSDLNPLKK